MGVVQFNCWSYLIVRKISKFAFTKFASQSLCSDIHDCLSVIGGRATHSVLPARW